MRRQRGTEGKGVKRAIVSLRLEEREESGVGHIIIIGSAENLFLGRRRLSEGL